MNGCLVELPGTAPGSDPLITRAFMSIVPKDLLDIGVLDCDEKGQSHRLRSLSVRMPAARVFLAKMKGLFMVFDIKFNLFKFADVKPKVARYCHDTS